MILNEDKEKNIKLYKYIEQQRKEKKITYENISDLLGLRVSTVFAKFKKLSIGKSVKTEFLFQLEKILDIKIFFDF